MSKQVMHPPNHANRIRHPGGQEPEQGPGGLRRGALDRKSTRLNSSHANISYAVFCLKKKYFLNSTTTSITLKTGIDLISTYPFQSPPPSLPVWLILTCYTSKSITHQLRTFLRSTTVS